MSIINDFVKEGSAVNSNFYASEKANLLISDFIQKRDILIKSKSDQAEFFFNLKLLEEEFRKSYHLVESPFMVSNFIMKVFLHYKFAPDFSFLTVKGVFFGLKLFFQDIASDEDVVAFFREILVKRLRDFELELTLLIYDFFELSNHQNKSVLVEIVNRKIKESSYDESPKKRLKIIMQMVSKAELYQFVDTNFILDVAINQEMFDEAFCFAKPSKNCSIKLLSLLVPSKNSKHMRQLIIKHDLEVDAFPQLFEFMRYGFFRYAVKEIGADIVEEKATQNPADLIVFLRYLLQNKLRDNAFSVYMRNIKQHDLSQYAEEFANTQEFTYLENEAQKKDEFAPTSIIRSPELAKEFFHLHELGYDEDSVVVVKRANFNVARDCLNQATVIGIDSEFFTNDCSGFSNQVLSTIQLATPHQVFIFDCFDLGSSFKMTYFIHQLLKNDKILKLAHTFESDIKVFQEFFNNEKPFEVNNLICVENLENSSQKIGLASLCKKYLLKRICKVEQMSAWNNTPLRRAQVHYAALDAAILLRLFEVMREKDKIMFSENSNEFKKKRRKFDCK